MLLLRKLLFAFVGEPDDDIPSFYISLTLFVFSSFSFGSLVTVIYIGLCRSKDGFSDQDLAHQLAKYDDAGQDEAVTTTTTSDEEALQEPLLTSADEV